jgi:hypothetical protein
MCTGFNPKKQGVLQNWNDTILLFCYKMNEDKGIYSITEEKNLHVPSNKNEMDDKLFILATPNMGNSFVDQGRRKRELPSSIASKVFCSHGCNNRKSTHIEKCRSVFTASKYD